MKHFEHRGVTMAYERSGDGPGVVFLHNGGASGVIWRNQYEALGDRRTVVAVDLPGFGASPRPTDGLDLGGHVALISALIDQLDLAPVLLVGNCMGSNIAAGVSVAHPELVRGLVLVNPLTEATFSAGGLGLLHKSKRWAPGPSALARRLSRAFVPPRAVASAVVRFQLGPRGAAAKLHRDPDLLACNMRRDQLPALVDVLDDMDAYRALDEARESQVPLCIVWGERNRVLSPEAGRSLDARLRPDREITLERCGHLAMLEDPGAMTSIIEEFDSAIEAHLFDQGAQP